MDAKNHNSTNLNELVAFMTKQKVHAIIMVNVKYDIQNIHTILTNKVPFSISEMKIIVQNSRKMKSCTILILSLCTYALL